MSREIEICCPKGINATKAVGIIEAARKVESKVHIIFKDREVVPDSVMRLLALGVSQGDRIKISGDDGDLDIVEKNFELILAQ